MAFRTSFRAASLVLPHRRPAVRIWKRWSSARTSVCPPSCGTIARRSASARARFAMRGSLRAVVSNALGWGIGLLLPQLGREVRALVKDLEGFLQHLVLGLLGVARHVGRELLADLEQRVNVVDRVELGDGLLDLGVHRPLH